MPIQKPTTFAGEGLGRIIRPRQSSSWAGEEVTKAMLPSPPPAPRRWQGHRSHAAWLVDAANRIPRQQDKRARRNAARRAPGMFSASTAVTAALNAHYGTFGAA